MTYTKWLIGGLCWIRIKCYSHNQVERNSTRTRTECLSFIQFCAQQIKNPEESSTQILSWSWNSSKSVQFFFSKMEFMRHLSIKYTWKISQPNCVVSVPMVDTKGKGDSRSNNFTIPFTVNSYEISNAIDWAINLQYLNWFKPEMPYDQVNSWKRNPIDKVVSLRASFNSDEGIMEIDLNYRTQLYQNIHQYSNARTQCVWKVKLKWWITKEHRPFWEWKVHFQATPFSQPLVLIRKILITI